MQNSFETFILSRAAVNPVLISETPRTIALGSDAITIDDVHRRVLAPYVAKGCTASNSTVKEAVAAVVDTPQAVTAAEHALLLRALVDTPLLPLGGEHLLYEVLWPAFTAATSAAAAVHASVRTLAEHDEKEQAEQLRRAQQTPQEAAAEAERLRTAAEKEAATVEKRRKEKEKERQQNAWGAGPSFADIEEEEEEQLAAKAKQAEAPVDRAILVEAVKTAKETLETARGDLERAFAKTRQLVAAMERYASMSSEKERQ